jgi:hypothetical protein
LTLPNGDIERWARAYRDHGRITVAENAREARAALVNDWSRADGEAIMIAARRSDVRDLNDRARALLKANGRLSKAEVEIAGRGFAEGDRVVGTRNDRQRGILNGQLGHIREIDERSRMVKVRLDNGREVTFDSGYLADGHLDHAYALTAHKAQGATVDRAFVLGSEDLYRELGYTALSRHRDEARFYVARGDIEPKVERDIPNYDPVISGLQDLLRRSGAKRLAHDSLPDRDTDELKQERDQLRKVFEDRESPRVDDLQDSQRERDRSRGAVDAAEKRIDHLQDLRDHTGLFDFRERRRIDEQLANAREQHARDSARHDRASMDHGVAAERVNVWLDTYIDPAERLIATDRELIERRRLERIATNRRAAVERTPGWPERELPTPDLTPGRDLGIDPGL